MLKGIGRKIPQAVEPSALISRSSNMGASAAEITRGEKAAPEVLAALTPFYRRARGYESRGLVYSRGRRERVDAHPRWTSSRYGCSRGLAEEARLSPEGSGGAHS